MHAKIAKVYDYDTHGLFDDGTGESAFNGHVDFSSGSKAISEHKLG
jgi:hypothetical protein